MLRACRPGNPGIWLGCFDGRPFESPVGLRMLLPGLLQFRWGQRQRGWVLVGSFASALAVGLWTWGSSLSLGLSSPWRSSRISRRSRTCFAKVRSRSIRPKRATFLVSSALAIVFYFPTFVVLSEVAWPGFEPANTGSGLPRQPLGLSGASKPHQGQWIWMKLPPLGRVRGRPGCRGFRPRGGMDRDRAGRSMERPALSTPQAV